MTLAKNEGGPDPPSPLCQQRQKVATPPLATSAFALYDLSPSSEMTFKKIKIQLFAKNRLISPFRAFCQCY